MTKSGVDGCGSDGRLIAVNNLQEFFRDSMEDALRSRNLRADVHTTHYVVNLLTMFARSERLYEHTGDGLELRPLAFMLKDALASPSQNERDRCLQRLGDVALFIAGFFARSFSRKAINVDYYIAMGGNAYSFLSNSMRGSSRPHVFCDIFAELSRKFQPFVDVLNEIADSAHAHTDKDIMHLYELWLRTGSPRAAERLRSLGVVPLPVAPPDRLQ